MSDKVLVSSLLEQIVNLADEASDLREQIKKAHDDMKAKHAEYQAHMELAQQKVKEGSFTFSEAKVYVGPYVKEHSAAVEAARKAQISYMNSSPIKKAGECYKRVRAIMKTTNLGEDLYRTSNSIWDQVYHHPV
jgi:uncharacterized coiled-coil DUF342 family protein